MKEKKSKVICIDSYVCESLRGALEVIGGYDEVLDFISTHIRMFNHCKEVGISIEEISYWSCMKPETIEFLNHTWKNNRKKSYVQIAEMVIDTWMENEDFVYDILEAYVESDSLDELNERNKIGKNICRKIVFCFFLQGKKGYVKEFGDALVNEFAEDWKKEEYKKEKEFALHSVGLTKVARVLIPAVNNLEKADRELFGRLNLENLERFHRNAIEILADDTGRFDDYKLSKEEWDKLEQLLLEHKKKKS